MRKERPTESQTNKKPELGEVVQADKPGQSLNHVIPVSVHL